MTGNLSNDTLATPGTINNTGVISGSARNLLGSALATVNNWGTIGSGVNNSAGSASIANYGTIYGNVSNSLGVGHGTIINAGTISGAVDNSGSATIFNSGLVGSSIFIGAGGAPGSNMLVNSGTIAGLVTISTLGTPGTVSNTGTLGNGAAFALAGGTAFLVNSGLINGPITLGTGPLSLTSFAGSRIVGSIQGSLLQNDVNFVGGNFLYTLSQLANASIDARGAPYVVSGNTVAVLDTTGFATNGRLLADFARGVSSIVPDHGSRLPATGGAMPMAFGAHEPASRTAAPPMGLGGLSSDQTQRLLGAAPTVVYAGGSAIWARGFGTQRVQQQQGGLLHTVDQLHGGAFGFEKQVQPDLRLGGFVGAGATRSAIEFNQGGTDARLVVGGAYSLHSVGASHLRLVVQGGLLNKNVTRSVANNLVAGGLESARASHDGWYISPEATIGRHIRIAKTHDAAYTLTPRLQMRYLYGSFDGYTEAGTTAPLTVSKQAVSTLEERAELTFARSQAFTPTRALSASVQVGVVGMHRLGNDTIHAALLGQAIPFAAPGPAHVWGGVGGGSIEGRAGDLTAFLATEYLVLSDRSSALSGRAGLRIGF